MQSRQAGADQYPPSPKWIKEVQLSMVNYDLTNREMKMKLWKDDAIE